VVRQVLDGLGGQPQGKDHSAAGTVFVSVDWAEAYRPIKCCGRFDVPAANRGERETRNGEARVAELQPDF
jgi:hypothetical protein